MKREWIIEIIKNNIQNIVVEDQLSGGDPPYLTHKYHNEWVGYDKAADAILALPLDVPNQEKLELMATTFASRKALTEVIAIEALYMMQNEIIKLNILLKDETV